MTVSIPLILAFALGLLLTLVLPVVLLIVLGFRKKIAVRPLLLGFLSFFLSQIVLRINLLHLLAAAPWYQTTIAANALLQVLFLSVTAGLFEESARLAGAKILKRVAFRDAVSFGLGHGFCEMILLVGLGHLSNLIVSVTMGLPVIGDYFIEHLPADQYAQLMAAFGSATVSGVLLGILERLSAVLFHLFATVLVFRGVVKGQSLRYLLLAIAAHAGFNLLVYTLQLGFPLWALELLWLALGGLGLLYVVKSRAGFHVPEDRQVR